MSGPRPLDPKRNRRAHNGCEILSPSTRNINREIKLPLYARYGVSYAWVVEPIEHVVEAYRLEAYEWLEVGCYVGTAQAAIPPFAAVPLDLGSLWMPTATAEA